MRRGTLEVPRPPVPQLAWLAAGMWTAAVGAEELSWRAYARALAPLAPYAVAGVALLVCALAAWRVRVQAVRLLALGIAVGTIVATAHWAAWRAAVAALAASSASTTKAVVIEDPQPALGASRVRVRLEDGRTAVVVWPGEAPRCGAEVSFRSALRPPPAGGGYARADARNGDVGEGRAWETRVLGWTPGPAGALMALRGRASTQLRGSDAGSALFASVVLGDRRPVSGTPVEQDFRLAGLGHVLAASALYAGAVFAAVRWLARRTGLPPPWQLALALTAATGYAAMGGFRASMVRGLIACAVAGAGGLAGRRHDSLAAVSLAVIAILAAWPAAVFDLGLALGVSVVAGLALFGRLANSWAAAVLPDRLARCARAPSAAAVAQLSALPLTAGAFGMVSLAGPIAVALLVPLLAAGLALGAPAAVLTAVAPRLAGPLLVAACRVFSLAAAAIHAVASLPGVAVALGPFSVVAGVAFAAAVAAVWIVWPQPGRRRHARLGAALLAGLLALRIMPLPASGAQLVVMDVGQGDAILLRDGTASMLVDCGPKPQSLRAALARQRVRRVDRLVLTHVHADHTGGLAGLAGVVSVGWAGAPETASAEDFVKEEKLGLVPAGRWGRLRAGESWSVGRTTVRVLWPDRPDASLSANDTSVVLLIERDGFEALLLGDAEERPQQHVLDEGVVPRLDVLKVAHHGSVNGLHEAALAAWSPRLALISVGAGNDFGHPAPSTLQALQKAGARVRRTDLDGDLTVDLTAVPRPRARGCGDIRCATIEAARRTVAGPPVPATRTESDGCLRPRRSEAGLPDIRRRGTAARARGPPPARAAVERRRPGLQLRRLRRRVHPRRRRAGSRQHAAVHV